MRRKLDGSWWSWALCNCVTVICLTILAVVFEKWWIILFAALLLFEHRTSSKD